MKSSDKINTNDLQKVMSMSNGEIEAKLKDILSTTNVGNLKKLIENADIAAIKEKLQTKDQKELSKIAGHMSKLDPELIKKIKDAIK
ncbi:MAG: hypothetical protein IKC41_07050 [Clostridia bacterium]|nr:hypothetical protein [Clostridia bacterium]MBR2878782.1 hypothetical protein [Clostridia bacterium]MBR2973946.1 hypothetical protein [Clostridia bacterium]